jgi:hypothetical protein
LPGSAGKATALSAQRPKHLLHQPVIAWQRLAQDGGTRRITI